MSDSIGRSEVELMLRNQEQWLENKMDRILSGIEILSSSIETRFTSMEAKFDAKFTVMDNEIHWLKWISLTVAGLMIASAGRVFFH